MKLKIMTLLVAMLAIVALLASCKPGGGDGEGNGGDGGNSKYPWGKTQILVQLYENDNGGELSSGLKRYYAGADTSAYDEVDNLVRNRNTAALADANVDVKYSYETSYGWGGSIDKIQSLTKSGTDSAPDVYCNFAYDMTSCALRGCFANLYANTDRTATKYEGSNYFTFTKSDYVGTSENYFDSEAGQGYFYDYMQSLAFANAQGQYDKMYCLASNYCVDLVRSFLVVPVNVKLLEQITVEATTDEETGANYDFDGDGDFTVADFYKLVWDYGWTYDALTKLSFAIYSDDNKATEGADINDRLGFCAGNSSGLTGSGILYTTSVKIITKTTDQNGNYTYAYPETNGDLVNLSNALYNLFYNGKGNGICTLSREQASAAGLGSGNDGELKAIRARFAENKVLFGGIIAVGSLEDAAYQGMKADAEGGFGVVPVPLYKEGDTYLTLVHNLARIVAISSTTKEFQQCSAFLDYQSTHSADILEMYYTENLMAAVEGGKAGAENAKMLTYIRNHVRDCFDKTYEDVISNYQLKNDKEASSKRWHGILSTNAYQVSGMDTLYGQYAPEKQTFLDEVLTEWAKLS